MADVIARTTVALSGWVGAPGVNVIHWVPRLTFPADVGDYTPAVASSFLAALRGVYNTLAPVTVNGWTASFAQETSLIEATTGALVGTVSPSSVPSAAGPGTADGDASRATQANVSLRTADFINSRRVQGRIFYGPIGSGALATSGTLLAQLQSDIATQFGSLLSSGSSDGQLAVWHRPTPGQSNGRSCVVTSVVGRALPASLRSRRD